MENRNESQLNLMSKKMLQRLRNAVDVGLWSNWSKTLPIFGKHDFQRRQEEEVHPNIHCLPLRFKYTLHKGVKGIRSRKSFYETTSNANQKEDEGNTEESTMWSRDLNMDEK